jgi:hypothetical protein
VKGKTVQTADLIERLSSEDMGAPRTGAAMRLAGLLATGCIVSFLGMWAWLGIRPDLAQAISTPAYWMKFAYTLALAAIALWLTERLGRPGVGTSRPQRMILIPLAIIFALAIAQLAIAPATARLHLLMGASSHVCPWRIVALSLPIYLAAALGMRQLAPTRLIAAGAATGLLAGAAGAWIYAFHCDESAAPFVALWYTLGIAVVGAIGGASGKWLLRW